MRKTILHLFMWIALLAFASCGKHAEKISSTYIGSMELNDSIVSENAQVIIEEVSKDIVSISSSYFNTYECKLSA